MPTKNVTDMSERCEAWVYDMYGRKIKGRCVNRRHVLINDKELCRRHAALEALYLLLKEKRAKVIVHEAQLVYLRSVVTNYDGRKL